MKGQHLVITFIFAFFSRETVLSFTGTIRFSDDFYAAQKYFYGEAKKKFPKITKEKFYPEVPIMGIATVDELKHIMPLMDFYEARRKFMDEVNKYPEQIYPEIFTFLNNHPALNVSPTNKAKFQALEKYFLPFNYLFCSDKNYYFNPEVKSNPCPIIFYYVNDKKNAVSFNLSNASKSGLSLSVNEGTTREYFTLSGKNQIGLSAGSAVGVKLTVNVNRLKEDSIFRTFNFIFSDPAQPRVKIIVPVILLPSGDHLNLPVHFFDVVYNYNTHFKNIDLYTDRTSGPEPCSGKDCSGERHYLLRSPDRMNLQYSFGEQGTVQYNLMTQSPLIYTSRSNRLQVNFSELGQLQGKGRNCPGAIPESSGPCPPDAPNNGKQIYGSRKIEMKLFIPSGKFYDLAINLVYTDLKTQNQSGHELSWLQDKKLVLLLTDADKKIIAKEFANNNQIVTERKKLGPGIYTLAVFPVTEDSNKLNPSFELNYLNHAGQARFDFFMQSTWSLSPSK